MMVSFRNFQRIHLVGIGGIGMSGIAEVLLTLGYSVSGSDLKPSTITERLQNLGATIFEGHQAANVEGAHVVAVVTTIDREHLDQYSSLEDIQDAFLQFVNRVPFYGAAVLCLDEPNVQAIIPDVKRPIITYGTSPQADLVISDVEIRGLGAEFRLTYKGEDLGMFLLPHPPGSHAVRNASAAAAVALYLNVASDLIREGLAKFAGVDRRFDIKGVVNDITVVDDYGHRPAEIRATLKAARD